MCEFNFMPARELAEDSPLFTKASDFVPKGLRQTSRGTNLGGEFTFSGIELCFEPGENR